MPIFGGVRIRVLRGKGMTDLVEIDIHAFELKVGRAVVSVSAPTQRRSPRKNRSPESDEWGNIHARAIKTMLARDGLPTDTLDSSSSSTTSNAARGGTNQKAAPIWLPYRVYISLYSNRDDILHSHIGRSEDEPVDITSNESISELGSIPSSGTDNKLKAVPSSQGQTKQHVQSHA